MEGSDPVRRRGPFERVAMSVHPTPPKPSRSHFKAPRLLRRIVEHKLIDKVSYEKYRAAVRDKYDGPQGALLSTASFLSLHLSFGDRLFRKRVFDLRDCKRILD